MPSFLTPAFLAGLIALAVPVLVHLRLRERRTAQPFPSLMFVRQVPHRSSRRRTLQNLGLFAARALALVLLCLAFARPFFPDRAGDSGPPSGRVGRVIALDVSASMGYQGVFKGALAQAELAVRELDRADSVGLLLFSDRVRGIVPPSTDHAKVLTTLRDVTPGDRSTRFAPALRLAADWLSALKVERREVVLVTDAQTRALSGVADVALPPGASVAVRRVAREAVDNAAIADITVEHLKQADRSFAIVTARLIHQGASARTVGVRLEVAGRTIEETSVPLPENGAVSVTFTRAPLPALISRGRVVLEPDGLEVDNAFHFVLGAGRDIPVLLVDSSPYVARALEIGDDPSFDVVRRGNLKGSDMADRSLIVLGDGGASGMSRSASSALARFVREGGGLLATAPLTGLGGEAARILPASWGETISRLTDRGASLGFVDLEHPALFAFKQARGSDFSRARFLQYRLLRARADPDLERLKVLARFDDGHEALVEARFGAGRVVAFTSRLDGLMSDLPLQPLFLPLVHELARYAAAHQARPLYHRVGASVDLGSRRKATTHDRPSAVIGPGGQKHTLAAGVEGIEIQDSGFYAVVRESGGQDMFAANIEPAESDLSALDPDELEVAIRPSARSGSPAIHVTEAEAGARQEWWRLALWAVAALMLIETVLGNARGRKVTP